MDYTNKIFEVEFLSKNDNGNGESSKTATIEYEALYGFYAKIIAEHGIITGSL